MPRGPKWPPEERDQTCSSQAMVSLLLWVHPFESNGQNTDVWDGGELADTIVHELLNTAAAVAARILYFASLHQFGFSPHHSRTN